MSKPWEQYQAEQAKPWEQYAPAPEQAATSPAPQTGMLEGLKNMVMNDPMVSGPLNGLIGGVKELGSTGYSLAKALGSLPGPTAWMGQAMPAQKPDILESQNPSQKMGGAIMTGLEYGVPGSAVAKIPAIASSGLAAQSLAQALTAGGVSAVRGDSTADVAKNALMTGGLNGLFGAVSQMAGPAGERIELSLLKPLKADLQDVKGPPELAPQTMVKNLYKYDLGGTLAESYEKAQAKTTELGQQLRQALQSNPNADVDMGNVLTQTRKELGAATASNFGTNENISKALDKMANEIKAVSPTGMVNIADAQDMKQALGYMGSWQNGLRDADSTATETVANTMYSKLKTAIEDNSGQGQAVKDINNQFSEIIPIKNALIRRIPVAARREPISLKEFIGLASGNVSSIGLSAADRLMRSGTVANQLVQASKGATNASPRATALAQALQQLYGGNQ